MEVCWLLLCTQPFIQPAAPLSVIRVLEWSTTSDQQVRVVEKPAQSADMIGAKFDPQAENFVVYAADGRVFFGDVGSEPLIELTRGGQAAHAERISKVAFSREGRQVVTGSEDNQAVLWNIGGEHWHTHGHLLEVHEDEVAPNTANINDVDLSNSGRKVVTASADGRGIIWQWDVNQKRFRPHFSINVSGATQGLASAMVQAEFVNDESEDDRFVFCRWSDNTVRIFDTLFVPNPIKDDVPLLNGRDVASFLVPHSTSHAYLLKAADGSWQITAVGREEANQIGASADSADCDWDLALSWGAQLKISQWKFQPHRSNRSEPAALKPVHAIASMLSARELGGEVQPLEPRPVRDVLKDWEAEIKPTTLLKTLDTEQLVAWHLNEADSSLFARQSRPATSLWHWAQVEKLAPNSLPATVELRRACAFGMTSNWKGAKDSLAVAEKELKGKAEFLHLRAAISLMEACSADGEATAQQSAISDLIAILEQSKDDQITRARLAKLYLQMDDNADAFRELDLLIESASDNSSPDLLRDRASVRYKLEHDWQSTFDDLELSAKLYYNQKRFDEALLQFERAIDLFEESTGEARSADQRKKLADLYTHLALSSSSQTDALETQSEDELPTASRALLKASRLEPDNLERMITFINTLGNTNVPSFEDQWIAVDGVFEEAMKLSPNGSRLLSQRIEALIPPSLDDPAAERRFKQAIEIYEQANLQASLTEEQCLNWAALHVRLEEWEEAEQVLAAAWQSHPNSSLIGLRLGLVQLKRVKLIEFKQTVQRMLEVGFQDPGDKNNVAWIAAYSPRSLDDFAQVLRLAEDAAQESPNDPIYLNTLGAAHLRAGNTSAALERLVAATRHREARFAHNATNGQRLIGNAMDLVLMAMAQTGKDAHEALSKAQNYVSRYRRQWTATEIFSDWVWNNLEFEVLEAEARQWLAR